ncbi:hypothetical protein IAQ61_007057 [Plenodomus lingam]|uniref:uncharacterized protein n=1 Tax=Leptosphaeria maculans TaxID=5022 RepID=UPI00332FE1D7|nr:hypothetical protein IAQ61_007057 [Plenodomus lingam]
MYHYSTNYTIIPSTTTLFMTRFCTTDAVIVAIVYDTCCNEFKKPLGGKFLDKNRQDSKATMGHNHGFRCLSGSP